MILGIIPARGGSKGIEKKNLVKIAGKPLIYYTFKSALNSKILDRTILSTDDEEIAKYGREIGIEVPFIRPKNLAEDSSSLESVLEHAINWLEINEDYKPDAIMLLQPTSPLRTSKHIDEAINKFKEEKADSLISVSNPQEHPMEMVYFKDNKMNFALDRNDKISGRQNYPDFYFVNGAIYLTKVELFKKEKKRWCGKTIPYLMNSLDSIDVDTKDDLVIAEALIKRIMKE